MAYGSTVTFRGFTFPAGYVNSAIVGTGQPRVKLIHYPGFTGAVTLNMKRAERRSVHTGRVLENTQTSMNSQVTKIESICDGGVGTLVFKGQNVTLTTTHSESIEWGPMRKFLGFGGATSGSYFATPFTITYVTATI